MISFVQIQFLKEMNKYSFESVLEQTGINCRVDGVRSVFKVKTEWHD